MDLSGAVRIEHEGLLREAKVQQVMGPSSRPRQIRQLLLSAEERSRIELWREYGLAGGVKFSAGYQEASNRFLGDEAGGLHYSRDGRNWALGHRFGSAVTGVVRDAELHSRTWVCTEAGEIWYTTSIPGDEPPGSWTWTLAYTHGSELVGIGQIDEYIIALPSYGRDVVRGADAGAGAWSVVQVMEGPLHGRGISSHFYAPVLWLEVFNSRPYYTTDGETWHRTVGAAGNAIQQIGHYDGTTCACGPGGIWRTTDDGDTWTEVLDAAPKSFGAIAGGPGGWAAVRLDGAVFVSSDDGQTWTQAGGYASGSVYTGVIADGERPVAVVMHGDNADQGRMLAVCEGGVMMSNDNGASWRGGLMAEPLRVSIEAYQPISLALSYDVPANQRLVGAASVETLVLVGT